jgi:chromosome segregation ATPase
MISVETLALIERDWKEKLEKPEGAITFLTSEIRKLWNEISELMQEIEEEAQVNKNKVVPLDGIERNALKAEIEEKRLRLLDAQKEIEVLKDTVNEYESQKKDLRKQLDFNEEDKLELQLSLLEKKFK